jgi:23S rRNA (guanosine2251-2'-O)-methyltransferase
MRAGRAPEKLYYLASASGIHPLLSAAKSAGAVLRERDRKQLDAMSLTGSHQGVIAVFPAYAYAQPDAPHTLAAERGEPFFCVVCDGVEDERNLGAVIRCAEAAGAHGVVIPKHRSASLSPVAAKAAAGAEEHIPVVRVPGIPSYLRCLKERGVWVFGADPGGGCPLFSADFSVPCAVVVGSEGRGLSRLTAECCDFLVSIPMRGRVESLNVSAAAAVMLYQALKTRTEKGGAARCPTKTST